MTVNAEMGGLKVRAVEHDVVWCEKLAAGHDFETKPEHMATIDGIGIWVADLEGCDGRTDSVETLLLVCLVLFESLF